MADTKSKSSILPWRAPGLAGRIAHRFIDSKLTPLVIVAALLIGAFSILKTPREEEPQIVVPMLDVFVQMPGASAEEVEQRVSVPTEKLLRDVPGVEYVYSISHPGVSLLMVRFYVGTKKKMLSCRPTISSTPTSIAFRLASRNRSLRSARLMMYRSWP